MQHTYEENILLPLPDSEEDEVQKSKDKKLMCGKELSKAQVTFTTDTEKASFLSFQTKLSMFLTT